MIRFYPAATLILSACVSPSIQQNQDNEIYVSNNQQLSAVSCPTRASSLGIIVDVFPIENDQYTLPNFADLRRASTFCIDQIELSKENLPRGWGDMPKLNSSYGMVARSMLEIEEPSTYHFSFVADNPARLYINYSLVVDVSDGESKTVSQYLDSGSHPFMVEYLGKKNSTPFLKLSWSRSKNETPTIIPNNVFRFPDQSIQDDQISRKQN